MANERLTPKRLTEIRARDRDHAEYGREHTRAELDRCYLLGHIDAIEAELAYANAQASAFFEHRLPCREAEVAQARYEAAEAEVIALRGQCVRWEAMYEGMSAEMDAYQEDKDKAEGDRYFRALLDIVEGPENENPYRVAGEALMPAWEVEA